MTEFEGGFDFEAHRADIRAWSLQPRQETESALTSWTLFTVAGVTADVLTGVMAVTEASYVSAGLFALSLAMSIVTYRRLKHYLFDDIIYRQLHDEQ